ncbi:MAG: chromosome segregation protein SMC [Planctomycetota bacterium]|nr:chromosome segregation protein SMC [Planctomycetota bacterium]
MFLKKLELLGFKSFVERTDFHFHRGVTAIVGPNGCGKSNIVDAFKWIFGEQSAKGLRGSEMKDVIFNGTQTRKPAGYAEVTVVFDNEDGFLDIDYAEVAVTRRLFRSGESEYLINKQKCRLKDIRELFLDTGIGQTSYSILEQGKIDVLLQSSPADRRVIFEEAAGISRYRLKKAETLRALVRVEDNLSRLQDIVDEGEKRIRRVKLQATKARKYKEHSDRLKELRVRVALEDYHQSVEERTDLAFGLYWAKARAGRLADLERRLASGLDDHLEKRQTLLERVKTVREHVAQQRSASERIQERLEQCRERLTELADNEKKKKSDLEATEEGVDKLRRSLEEEREKLAALERDVQEKKARVEELAAELKARQAAHGAMQLELQARKDEVVEAIQSRARIANALVQVSSETDNLRSRGERLHNSVDGFRRELETCHARQEEVREELRRVDVRKEAVSREQDEIQVAADRLEKEITKLEDELSRRQEELHRKSSRLDVLESFEERLDGVATGVADLLRCEEEISPAARSLGMVASLLRVDRQHARAVEAALGVQAQALVVETQEGALALLDFARRKGIAGVQVIALDRVDHVAPEVFPRQGGVLGSLRDVVDVSENLRELFDRLLANVVLVEDLSTAVALARNGLRPFRLATLLGEVIEPWGGLSLAGDAERGLISRRSEMEELKVEVEELEQLCHGLRQDLSRQRERLGRTRDTLEAKRASVEGFERQALSLDSAVEQQQGEAGRLEREIQVGRSELEEIERELAVRGELRAAHEVEARAIDRHREETERAVVQLEERLGESTRDLERLGERVAQNRLERAQAEEQGEGLREILKRQSLNLEERERHTQDLRQEIESFARRGAETQETLDRSTSELEAVGEREVELASQLEGLEEEDRSLVALEKGFRREMERVRTRVAEVTQERGELQLRDQEERHRRNTILERIDEQYGIDLKGLLEKAGREAEEELPPASEEIPGEEPSGDEDGMVERARAESDAPAVDAATAGAGETPAGVESSKVSAPVSEEETYLLPLADWDRDAAHEEIKALQEKIRRLGNVNLDALEELEELEERHRFQHSQRSDLHEGEKKLRGIINEINRKSREMFLDTFGKVQEHFNELFRKSFGGGRAELVLEESEDVLEAGIEIVARPPGKKLTSLSLMSGGEKTMTTIALLLAIFRTRPSPFCVLDEVDAPLDDSNVERFIVLLKDFVVQSQFIIIPPNHHTRAEASMLYGVTTQERGVSKKVAVELATYDPESLEMAASGTGAG